MRHALVSRSQDVADTVRAAIGIVWRGVTLVRDGLVSPYGTLRAVLAGRVSR